jgi:hypothetical protein
MSSRSAVKAGAFFTARASRVGGEGLDEIEVVARDDAAWARRHDDQMRAEEQRLLNGMRDEEDPLARTVPDFDEQLLHLFARQAVERAERLVH